MLTDPLSGTRAGHYHLLVTCNDTRVLAARRAPESNWRRTWKHRRESHGVKHGQQNQILVRHPNPFELQSDSRQTVRLAATLAAERLDTSRHGSTTTEHRDRKSTRLKS